MSNTYTGQAVVKPDKKGLTYKVAIGKNNAIITTKHDHLQQPTKITSENMDVYGKSPLVKYECDSRLLKCWIKNPSNYGEWITITYNEQSARDLADSLRLLIKLLQKND